MASRQQANVPLILTIGTVSGVLLLVLTIGVQSWFLRETQVEVIRKWENVAPQPLTSQRAAQWANLHPRSKSPTTIPIEDAVQYVIEHRGNLTKPSEAVK